jgi:hypothetical protein
MLASTVQFSKNGRPPTNLAPTAATSAATVRPWQGSWAVRRPEERACARSPQDPTTCQAPPPPAPRSPTRSEDRARTSKDEPMKAPTNRCSTLEHPLPHTRGQTGLCTDQGQTPAGEMLLRKEVIQPHLPVRLPCYDLVPIASPTFDGSPSCELGHRLRVLPTFVT